jgi:hypothetical protein
VDTVVAVLRDRLAIPPLPIQDEPSPSVFNSTFTVSSVRNLIYMLHVKKLMKFLSSVESQDHDPKAAVCELFQSMSLFMSL